MADTAYIVFKKNGDGSYEVLDNSVLASTSEGAMKIVADKIALHNEQPIEAIFAATPLRNWKQLPVGVEVITRVKVG